MTMMTGLLPSSPMMVMGYKEDIFGVVVPTILESATLRKKTMNIKENVYDRQGRIPSMNAMSLILQM